MIDAKRLPAVLALCTLSAALTPDAGATSSPGNGKPIPAQGGPASLSCSDGDGGANLATASAASLSIGGQAAVVLKDLCAGDASALGDSLNQVLFEAVCAGGAVTYDIRRCADLPATGGALPGTCVQTLGGGRCAGCEHYNVPGAPDPFTTCGGACVKLLTDGSNCGACGNACGGTTPFCIQGQCASAAPSCNALHDAAPSLASGVYMLAPAGYAPFQAYCDMDTDGGGWTLVARIRGDSNEHDAPGGGAIGVLTSPAQASVARLPNATLLSLKLAGDGLVRLNCGDTGKVFSDLWIDYRTSDLPAPRNYSYEAGDEWSVCDGSSYDHTGLVSTEGRCKGSTDERDASYGCGCDNLTGCSVAGHQWGQDGALWVR